MKWKSRNVKKAHGDSLKRAKKYRDRMYEYRGIACSRKQFESTIFWKMPMEVYQKIGVL